jgi:hypothetical protein
MQRFVFDTIMCTMRTQGSIFPTSDLETRHDVSGQHVLVSYYHLQRPLSLELWSRRVSLNVRSATRCGQGVVGPLRIRYVRRGRPELSDGLNLWTSMLRFSTQRQER